MSCAALPDAKRLLLNNYMIEFVIQRQNALDCFKIKTWQIFARILSPHFKHPPNELQLEFFCHVLPNLENYTFDSLYVDYFNKIRHMPLEAKRKLLGAENEYLLREIAPRVAETECCVTQGHSQRHVGKLTPSLVVSVPGMFDVRAYDKDFMRDALLYFAHVPPFRPPKPVKKFLGLFVPCWEIQTLLQSYPEQFVSEFMWWRLRVRDRRQRSAPEPQKRHESSDDEDSPRAKKKQK